MRPYSPGGPLKALAATHPGSSPRASSGHRLQPGLPGYLIPFAPLAFAPQRQELPRKVPSPSVFFRISTHFTAPRGIPLPSPVLKSVRICSALSQLSRELSPQTPSTAYRPFTPSNSGQRSPPTYYRGCWHVVSRDFFLCYRPLARHREKQFTLRKASSCTRRCSVRLAPIAENSSLLPPVGVWAVLNPSVADRPLRPATDCRLGRPLPHQPS